MACDYTHPSDSCIDLEKAGPASAQPGGLITYTFTVSNCGSKLLHDVWVADPRILGCRLYEVGKLKPGDTYRFEGTYRVPPDQCGDLTNSARAVGRSTHGSRVCDADWWVVDVPCPPALEAEVQVAKRPRSQTIEYGTSATFTIAVTNTGEVDLADVIVDDPRAMQCSRSLASLPAGASTSYQCAVANVTDTFTNVVVATASAPLGEEVFDQDEANVTVVVPAMEIHKGPDPAAVERGGTVTFTIGITNSGDVPLGPVAVHDPLAPACDRSFADLAPGGAIRYNCGSPRVAASFTNTVYVTATTPGGALLAARDEARVVIGSLSIEKYLGIGGVPAWQQADTPPGPAVLVGTPVWFWLMARNTGDGVLTNVALTDSALDLTAYEDCATSEPLAPGGVFQCVVGPLAAEEGQHSDVAQVTGELGGKMFAAEDAVYYLGYDGSGAAIDLEKYIAIDGGEWQDADTIDAAPEVPAGPDDEPLVQFLFAVLNTGAVPLYDVVVTDTDLDLSACPAPPSPLGTGASYECIVELPRAFSCLQTNVGTATGYHEGLPYRDTDAVHYQGVPCSTPTRRRTYLPLVVR
jgi:uncharacterized repeat protein (TIGR01451 family)